MSRILVIDDDGEVRSTIKMMLESAGYIDGEAADGEDLMIRRRPEWLHAWAAFVENAVDFARTTVWVRFEVTNAYVSLTIEDDGSGFAPDILSRLGDPYISSRVFGDDAPAAEGRSYSGMGLGFFIAKTLREQTGATVKAVNLPGGGARVNVMWPRGVIDGESPPTTAQED